MGCWLVVQVGERDRGLAVADGDRAGVLDLLERARELLRRCAAIASSERERREAAWRSMRTSTVESHSLGLSRPRPHAATIPDADFGGQYRFSRPTHPSRMHFPSHEQKQALLEQVLRIADQRLRRRGREGSARLHRALLRPGRRRGPRPPQRRGPLRRRDGPPRLRAPLLEPARPSCASTTRAPTSTAGRARTP